MGDVVEWRIDWWVPLDVLKSNVERLIGEAVEHGTVLCLPINVLPGKPYLDMLTLILSQVHCSVCDAPCCRGNPRGIPFDLPPSEYERLSKKYGSQHFILGGDGDAIIPMPCPFLEGGKCSIYEDRPSMCVLYPVQPGGTDENSKTLSLAPTCPEARRITRQVYTSAWWIRHQFRMMKELANKEVLDAK